MEVYVRPPGLEIGDLRISQRRRTLDRARQITAEWHEDTGIHSRSSRTVDMARRWGKPRIGDGPAQRLAGSVERRRGAALACAGDRWDLAGAAEICLEVDLLGPCCTAEQECSDDSRDQPWRLTHALLPRHFIRMDRLVMERSDEKPKMGRDSRHPFKCARGRALGAYARAGGASRIARERAACATASKASRQTVSAGRPVSFMCNSACAIRSSCARHPASFHSTSWRLKQSSCL